MGGHVALSISATQSNINISNYESTTAVSDILELRIFFWNHEISNRERLLPLKWRPPMHPFGYSGPDFPHLCPTPATAALPVRGLRAHESACNFSNYS